MGKVNKSICNSLSKDFFFIINLIYILVFLVMFIGILYIDDIRIKMRFEYNNIGILIFIFCKK